MVAQYHVEEIGAAKVAGTIVDALDQLAREGARHMLQRALEVEVEEFLGRERYQRSQDFRGYRAGTDLYIAVAPWTSS